MKASQLLRGRRAVRRVKFPVCNAGHLSGRQPPELAQAQQEAGVLAQEAPDVGIRAMTGLEWAEVLRQAADFATSRGGKAEDADERYQLGKMVHALALGCVDPDDPQHGLFFDGGVQQILESVDLGRDGIAYLYEQLELWQDETHPQQLTLTPAEMSDAIVELAGAEDSSQRFFASMRAGARWACTRVLASTLQSFLTSSSTTIGSSPETSAKPSRPRPPRGSKAPRRTSRGRGKAPTRKGRK